MKTPILLKTIIALFAIALSAQSALSQGPSFDLLLERHDKDGNGSLEKTEMGLNPNLFKRTDRNQDGTITKAEFDTAIQERRNRSASRRLQPGKMLPDGVTAHRNIEYAVAEQQPLQLDLYLPETTNPPLIVWIHGGGWKNGDKANVNPAILRLTGEGYAVASINYRLKDLSIHPKNIHDCKGAVRWLRANSAEYGYDPNRVAVAGSSAGGHLSLLLGMSSGVEELEGTIGGHTNQSTAVKAIVDFYGPSDLIALAETQQRFNRVHDFKPGQLDSASPLRHLTQDDPPVLILHGDRDKTVPVEQSKLLHEGYQNAGKISELHIIEGAGHGGKEFSDDIRYKFIKSFLDTHVKILK